MNYICYYGVDRESAISNTPYTFASEEDLRKVLAESAGELEDKGIFRLDLEIPDVVTPTLVMYVFMGLVAKREDNPNNFVLTICKEHERGLEELDIRLKEAIDAARNARVPWSDVVAALTGFAYPE